MNEQNSPIKKVYKLENGFEIHWEDIEFLKHIRELHFGEVEKVQVVNGRVQSFKKSIKSVKIF